MNKKPKNKKVTGRPLKHIDKAEFEKLCALQCTIGEFCFWFDVTDRTLTSWCKRTYDMAFSEIFAIKRGKGKIALRRIQFRMAETSPAMAIWLGKQYLDQSDKAMIADGDINDKVFRDKFFGVD